MTLTPEEIAALESSPPLAAWIKRHPPYGRHLRGPEGAYWRSRLMERAGFADGPPLVEPGPLPRVGILVPGDIHGGIAEWLKVFLRSFRHDRLRWVGIAGLSPPFKYTDPGREAAFRAAGHYLDGPAGARRLAASCDVLLCWGVPDLGLYLPHRRPPATVVMSHAEDRPEVRAFVSTWMNQPYQYYLAASPLTAGAFPEDVPPHRISAIGPAVDPDHYLSPDPPEVCRARLGIPGGRRVLLWVGRFDRLQKRPQVWLRVLEALPDEWHGLMIQGGWADSTVEAEAGRLGLAERLTIVHNLPHMGDPYAAADILLIPSTTEGLPMVAYEAIGAGLPVVCTDACNIARRHPDWVRSYPVDADPSQIARLIRADIAGNGPRRAQEARPKLEALYGLEGFGEAMAALCVRLARRQGKPRVDKGVPRSGGGG